MGYVLLYPQRKAKNTTTQLLKGTKMPAPQEIANTAFAQLVARWMKAQRGFLSVGNLATITGIGNSVVRNWMYNGVNPEVSTLVKISTSTREYNINTNVPDYNDPLYPFDEPGIPLEMLTKACNVKLETAKDFWIAITEQVKQDTHITATERKERLQWLNAMWQWYKDGKPAVDNHTKAS